MKVYFCDVCNELFEVAEGDNAKMKTTFTTPKGNEAQLLSDDINCCPDCRRGIIDAMRQAEMNFHIAVKK